MEIQCSLLITGPEQKRLKINYEVVEAIEQAAKIMLNKNTERGDAWKATGVIGAFLQLHECYNRIRSMIWKKGGKPVAKGHWEFLDRELTNSLQDMRNYCILMEISLGLRLWTGDAREENLNCVNCGNHLKLEPGE